MKERLFSLAVMVFFNLISLVLIFSAVLQKRFSSVAQSNSEEIEPAVLVPRSTETAKDDDDEDGDGDDPPTDNDGTDSDGYDTPLPPTDNDGFDTPPPPTDNDGTDSDGYHTPASD